MSEEIIFMLVLIAIIICFWGYADTPIRGGKEKRDA